jgi:hypothetical protein
MLCLVSLMRVASCIRGETREFMGWCLKKGCSKSECLDCSDGVGTWPRPRPRPRGRLLVKTQWDHPAMLSESPSHTTNKLLISASDAMVLQKIILLQLVAEIHEPGWSTYVPVSVSTPGSLPPRLPENLRLILLIPC